MFRIIITISIIIIISIIISIIIIIAGEAGGARSPAAYIHLYVNSRNPLLFYYSE